METMDRPDFSEPPLIEGSSFLFDDINTMFEGLTPEGKIFAKTPNTEYLKAIEHSKLEYLKKIKDINIEDAKRRRGQIEAREEEVKKLRELQKLESDYPFYSEYYYDKSKNRIYELKLLTNEVEPTSYKQEIHLRELNKISKEVDVSKIEKTSPWDGPIDHSKLTDFNKESEYEKAYKDIVAAKKTNCL